MEKQLVEMKSTGVTPRVDAIYECQSQLSVLQWRGMESADREFFLQSTVRLARQLLVSDIGGRTSGYVVETEAYLGPRDWASHCSRGGPASRLAQALGIDLTHNALDLLTAPIRLYVPPRTPGRIKIGKRVGISKHADRLLRFALSESMFLSKPI